MQAIADADGTKPDRLTPDLRVAACVLNLVSPQGRGLGPTPVLIERARTGRGRPGIVVSAALLVELLDAVEAAHPGAYDAYLKYADARHTSGLFELTALTNEGRRRG